VRAVVILARRQASAQQREVAERNAKPGHRRMERRISTEAPQPPQHHAGVPKKPSKPIAKGGPNETCRGSGPGSGEEAIAQAHRRAHGQGQPLGEQRRGCCDALRCAGARIVGNEVLRHRAGPKPGQTVQFDTSVARYVGAAAF